LWDALLASASASYGAEVIGSASRRIQAAAVMKIDSKFSHPFAP
jgi:hypothetical protein